MNQIEVPLLVYGKEHGESAVPKSYDILGPPPGYDRSTMHEAAEQALIQVSRAFAWRPHPPGVSRHPPCFGVWSLPTASRSAIAFRILDDGLDDQCRPRTVRIEAGIISDKEVLDDPRLLASLTRPEAWPEEIEDQAASIKLALNACCQVSEQVSNWTTGNSDELRLVESSSPNCFSFSWQRGGANASSPFGPNASASKPIVRTNVAAEFPRLQAKPQPKKSSMNYRLFSATLILVLVFAVGCYYLINWSNKIEELTNENGELKSRVKSRSDQYDDLQRKLQANTKQTEELESRLSAMQQKNADLQTLLTNDKQADLKKRITELESTNHRLEATVKRIQKAFPEPTSEP